MTYNLTFLNNDLSIKINEDELIIDAALRNGINFPYTCSKGFCGACKGELISGEVEYIKKPVKLSKLSEDEKTDKSTLFCCCTPKSDLIIDIDLIDELDGIEVKRFTCKITQLYLMSKDVMFMQLKLADNISFNFLAGQYIDILLDKDKKRSFSIANQPKSSNIIDLHIRNIDGGYFTNQVFNCLQVNDILKIDGPHGSFFYHKTPNKPLIFMAGGTGFAPVKSIVESLITIKSTLPIFIYWGVRDLMDLYQIELVEKWTLNHDNIKFIPVLSQCKDSNWNGEKGYVHEIICKDFDDLSTFDIYACGPPAMIESGKLAFLERGLTENNFYFDSFDFSND